MATPNAGTRIEIASRKIARNDNLESAEGIFLADFFIPKQMFVYIMTNKMNTVFYTGVTSTLRRRVYEHKEKIKGRFTSQYNVNKLVYYEVFSDAYNAIVREKQIKGGSRKKKIDLVEAMNPKWADLYDQI